MKNILLLLPLLFLSCKSYKAMMNEELSIKTDSIAYFVDAAMEVLPVKIDNKAYTLLFDTGSTVTIITNPTFVYSDTAAIGSRKIIGFDQKIQTKATTLTVDSLTSPIFSATKKIINFAPAIPYSCGAVMKYDGILERIVPPEGYMTELNYESGFLKFSKAPSLEGYVPLKARFSQLRSIFEVEMTVNGVKEYFLFDTGNKSMTTLNRKVFTNMGKKLYRISIIMYGINSINFDFVVDVYDPEIVLNNLKFNHPVGLDNYSAKSVLSLSFIKKFNWIFDQDNNIVYCKPIDLKKLTDFKPIKIPDPIHFVEVFDGKLCVHYLNYEPDKYALRDEIVSVNQKLVTSENACEMKKLLNENKDWESMQVQIKARNP